MRDYTTNNFCDFLWIGDLLELKQNAKKEFVLEVKSNENSSKITITNVKVFGTIVEVKQIGCSGSLYQVDDGTGVISCKHSEEQFEELIRTIESEQDEISNQTFNCTVSDTSANDSVFNDRSIQAEEIIFNKKCTLLGLQSIWDDIYKSFHCLIEPYSIGDSVVIEGKLYSYFNTNQIYVNHIRPLDIGEEIIQISVKLEDGFDKSKEKETPKKQTKSVNRMSGLLTFDNIPELDPRITIPRNMKSPKINTEVLDLPDIVTPKLESRMTFDTFISK